MHRKSLAILAVLVLLTSLVVAALPVSAGQGQRYVVVFTGNGIPNDAGMQIQAAGGEMVKTFPEVGVAIAVSGMEGFAASLRGARGIHSVGAEHFMTVPDAEAIALEATEPDPAVDTYYYAYQWDIRRVKADEAWEITSGSHDTVVAVLDTGIAYNHPDLATNVIYNACYSVYSPCIPYPSYHWHGTHVAGTVAAAFGGAGAVGVGPNLGLANYNVFEPTAYDPVTGAVTAVGAYDEAIWDAMLDVAEQGFDVINMSLGGYIVRALGADEVAVWTAWNRVADYVTRQGVTIVASSGNGSADLNGPLDHIPSDVTGVISVGATGIRPMPIYPYDGAYDVLAEYSNTGASVILAAPGGDAGPEDSVYPFYWHYFVFSDFVYPDPVCAATASCPLGYAWATGTSMASPHVAGAAGLVKDAEPKLSASQVATRLKQTAEPLGDRLLFGHGMVDAYAAVTK